MFRPRGNLAFTRKPSIDPTIGNEIAKLARAIPNLSYGDQFPGRGATFGDMHFYTGEDTTSYKKNNWYIRPVDADSNWQPMNATSVMAENIQAGIIGSGVKVTDSLQLMGGEMLGKIIFHETQTFKPEMLESGIIPPSVTVAGVVPTTGGIYLGSIDMTDHFITSIGKLYGFDNLIYIDMSIDGNLTLGADVKMSLISPSIELTGAFHMIGNSVFTGDVTATGTIEGNKLTDGIFMVQNGVITGASGLISQFTNDAGYQTSLAGDPVFLTQLDPQQFTDGALVGSGFIYLTNGMIGITDGMHRSTPITYISGTGVAGTDNTAMTIKTLVLPKNTLVQNGDRLRVRTYWKGDTGTPVTGSIKIGPAASEVLVSHTSDGGAATLQLNEVWLHYIDNTHSNIIENEAGGLGALSDVNVAGFTWNADQNIIFTQNAIANNHCVLYAVIVDIFPKGF